MPHLNKFTPTSAAAIPQPLPPSQTPASASFQSFDPALTIIRFPEVEKITGLARPTVYKRLKDDPTFPKPVALSDSQSRGAPVGWVLAEIQEWVRKRIELRVGGA